MADAGLDLRADVAPKRPELARVIALRRGP